MPNSRRGEIACLLDGKPFSLCLTLGALAELEHAFGHDDMLSLAERFQSGRLSASDAQRAEYRYTFTDLDQRPSRHGHSDHWAGIVDAISAMRHLQWVSGPLDHSP